MLIVEIAALQNGAHRNQNGSISSIPDGWAMVPESVEIPETFPFVGLTVEGQTVTAMTAGTVPEPEPEPETSEELTADAMAAAILEGVNDV